MARSKFRWFHLIIEICKSRFSHFAHPAHLGTYTFRNSLWGLQEICGDLPGFLIWDSWLVNGAFIFMSVRHCLGLLSGGWGSCGLLSFLSVCNSSHDELGISSSTASLPSIPEDELGNWGITPSSILIW